MNWTRIGLLVAGPVVIAIIGAYFYAASLGHVSTDDAYVKADMVSVSPDVSGRILKVNVKENQHVDKGDILFELDDATYQAGLFRANAQLDTITNQIQADKAEYEQRTEELAVAQENADYADHELHRLTELKKQRAVSQSDLDAAQHSLDVARHQVLVTKQQRAAVLARLDGNVDLPAEKHSSYLQAWAEREVIKTSIERCKVKAPFSGIASKVPELGQYASQGAPIMSIVSDTNVWIEANFKETDLTNVKIGQPATIRVDSYPDKVFQGEVESIAQATGGEFSVLPAQNATGNWVKVVQRIPLRIKVISSFPDAPLRAGSSTTVDIDTGGGFPSLHSVASR